MLNEVRMDAETHFSYQQLLSSCNQQHRLYRISQYEEPQAMCQRIHHEYWSGSCPQYSLIFVDKSSSPCIKNVAYW